MKNSIFSYKIIDNIQNLLFLMLLSLSLPYYCFSMTEQDEPKEAYNILKKEEPWSVLGISPLNSYEQAKTAYKKLSLKWHTDKYKGSLPVFQHIQNALQYYQQQDSISTIHTQITRMNNQAILSHKDRIVLHELEKSIASSIKERNSVLKGMQIDAQKYKNLIVPKITTASDGLSFEFIFRQKMQQELQKMKEFQKLKKLEEERLAREQAAQQEREHKERELAELQRQEKQRLHAQLTKERAAQQEAERLEKIRIENERILQEKTEGEYIVNLYCDAGQLYSSICGRKPFVENKDQIAAYNTSIDQLKERNCQINTNHRLQSNIALIQDFIIQAEEKIKDQLLHCNQDNGSVNKSKALRNLKIFSAIGLGIMTIYYRKPLYHKTTNAFKFIPAMLHYTKFTSR